MYLRKKSIMYKGVKYKRLLASIENCNPCPYYLSKNCPPIFKCGKWFTKLDSKYAYYYDYALKTKYDKKFKVN